MRMRRTEPEEIRGRKSKNTCQGRIKGGQRRDKKSEKAGYGG
jgi:hypothetical protein